MWEKTNNHQWERIFYSCGHWTQYFLQNCPNCTILSKIVKIVKKNFFQYSTGCSFIAASTTCQQDLKLGKSMLCQATSAKYCIDFRVYADIASIVGHISVSQPSTCMQAAFVRAQRYNGFFAMGANGQEKCWRWYLAFLTFISACSVRQNQKGVTRWNAWHRNHLLFSSKVRARGS